MHRAAIRFLAYFCVFLWIGWDFIELGDCHPAQVLHTRLLENYDKRVPPVTRWDEPVEVILEYSPLHFKGLNERLQIFQMYCWLATVWDDKNLSWVPDEYEGLTSTTLYGTDIWTPDLGVVNSADELYGPIFDTDRYELMLDYTGNVRLVTAGSVHTICILDVTLFPFDVQICHIEVDSWTLPFEKLHLSNQSIIYEDRLRANGAWDVSESWVHIHKEELRDIMFHTLSFVFKLRRKPQYVIINTIIPVFLISLLELLVFLIPVEAGEKISLGVTLMLSLTVFQLVIQSTMPETSDFLPVVSLYITSVLIISSLSLVFTVVVISIHYQNASKPIPCWVRKCFLQGMANAVCVRTRYTVRRKKATARARKDTGADLPNTEARAAIRAFNHVDYVAGKSSDEIQNGGVEEHAGADEDTPGEEANDWMELARVLDRFFFYVFVIVVILSGLFCFFKVVGENHQDTPLGGYGYKIRDV